MSPMKSALCLLFLTQTSAWWCTGHMLVAEVAQLDLEANDPAALAWAQTLVGYLAGPLTHGTSSTFVEAACWPDDIKVYALNAMDDWHFVDQPYNPDGIMNVVEFSNGNALWAIAQVSSTLIGTSGAEAPLETSIAMRYLIHLLGDMHQPLHVTELWNLNFPVGDQGGNLFIIQFDSIVQELHALWDSCMGRFEIDPVRPLNLTSWAFFESEASELMLMYPRASLVQELSDPSTSDWAVTNYHLAQIYAYNITYGQRPDAYYLEIGWQVIQKQLVLAGYRLSTMIQELFAAAPEIQDIKY